MSKTPTTLWGYVSRSTLKREFSSLVFIIWLLYGFRLMERVPVTQAVADAALVAWGALSPFMFGMIVGAYGTDWVSKQTTIAGPPLNTEIKTETKVTEDTATTVTSAEQKNDQ